ncbi:MAG: hypothetical protein ACP5MU_06595 [Thermoplasmata archaeon]
MNEFREMRAKIISSQLKKPLVVFRETPLFQYFCDDDRNDAILIEKGTIQKIGPKMIDQKFVENIPDELCCSSMSYKNRKCTECDQDIQQCFLHPLLSEVEIIKKNNSQMREIIISSLRENLSGSSEIEIKERLMRDVYAGGFRSFYDPIVAGDINISEFWHRSKEYVPEKILYVEISAMKDGLSSMFSETFIMNEDNKKIDDYASIIKGEEFIRENFVEGKTTEDLSPLENFRNKDIYLTTPLFPYSHIPFPGENVMIHTMDISVFDLWIMGKDYTIRKKITAVAGSHRATIL